MAFIALAVSAAINVAIAASLQVLSNVLGSPIKGARLTDLAVQVSTYGNVIARVFGAANRLAGNVIWSTGLVEKKHKKGGFLTPKVTTYTYSTSLAVVICERTLAEGPIEAVHKLWANGKVIFDAALGSPTSEVLDGDGRLISRTWDKTAGTHSLFDTLTLYGGGFEQTADPAIEAHEGGGNVPGYRGAAYGVITILQLKDFGNRVPNLEWLVDASVQTMADVAGVICAEAGIDAEHDLSTTALCNIPVLGYALAEATSCWDALKPLQAALAFEAAEQQGQIRFMRRAQNMRATIPLSAMAAHQFGDERPVAITYSRALETALPREAAVSFLDPDRDYQVNTQAERRQGGAADSNVTLELPISLPAAQGRAAAGRVLWEAWTGRQTATFAVTDQWIGLEAGRVYGVETGAGVRPYRITRRTRGANGIIELEVQADESAAFTYAPPANDASTPANGVSLGGPVNPPILFEPPAALTAGAREVWIAASMGDGGVGDGQQAGCDVYFSTDDTHFILLGTMPGPSSQGVLTDALALYGGANPDAGNTLAVSMALSGEPLASISAADAAIGNPPCYVDGEYVGVQTWAATGTDAYDGTDLYRGLYGSTAGLHASGAAFTLLDAGIFVHGYAAELVGVPLFYRFVGRGGDVAGATSYGFTPTGGSYSPGELSGLTDVDVTGVTDGQVLVYDVVTERWLPGSLAGPTDTAETSEAIAGPALGYLHAASGAKVGLADATDLTKPANCAVLGTYGSGDPATISLTGQWIAWPGLTPGATYWLATTPGEISTTPPAADLGHASQIVGWADAAGGRLFFAPQSMNGI
ncbi:MAG TPA: phage tail protein [Phenylobacterium sp.]